jgi:hypothetical protein
MLFRCVLLFLFLSSSGYANYVNWTQFSKIRAWTFEPDEKRFPNHSNIDPSIIDEYIGMSEPGMMRSIDHVMFAARAIGRLNVSAEQRAVLLRDCLDRVHALNSNWSANDGIFNPRTVVFYGGYSDKGSRFALAISLGEGTIYVGVIACVDLMNAAWAPKLQNNPEWQPVR